MHSSLPSNHPRPSQLLPALTRWAHHHPIQARIWISLIQIALIFTGFWVGHILFKLGYALPYWVFSLSLGFMMAGFAATPFWRKSKRSFLPHTIRARQVIFAGIGICTFVGMVSLGNTLEQSFPHLKLTQTVISLDQLVFEDRNQIEAEPHPGLLKPNAGPHDYEAALPVIRVAAASGAGTQPNHLSRKHMRKLKRKMRRKAVLAALSGGSAALILLLAFVGCMGVCLVGGGIAAIIGGIISGPAGWILAGFAGMAAGAGLAKLSINGIIKTVRKIPPEG